MSTQETTDPLLELLYDELEEEQRAEALDEVARDPELQADYAVFERMLGDIDRELMDEEPPEHVHEALMASARQHVRESVEETTRVEPRSPTNGASSRGFWGRMASSNSGQIALVATVLLVGAFVFKVVDLDNAPMPGSVPLEEGSSAPIVSSEASPAPVELDETVEETVFDFKGEPSPDDQARAVALEQEGQEETAPSELGRRAESSSGDKQAKKPEAPVNRRNRRVRTSPKPSPKKAAGAQRPASRGFEEAQGLDVDAVPSGRPAPMDAESDGKARDVEKFAALEDTLEAEEEAVYQPPTGTIAAVEESYSRGDYRETVREADRVLESDATQTQKARALELKAQSYRRMNQLSQADVIYRNIQTNFPDYSPGRIRQARDEIQRIQSQDRAPAQERRKVAPQKSQDSIELDMIE